MTSPTPTELITEMFRLSQALDKGLEYLLEMSREWAEAENDYRQAKAVTFLAADAAKVAARHMISDERCEKQRQRAYMARGQKEAAREAVRARRTQISALQTALNVLKEEFGFGRTGPEYQP